MPDLSDLVLFHSGQVDNFNLLVLGQVQNLYKVNNVLYYFHILINYYEFTCCISYHISYMILYDITCCIENSVDPDQLDSKKKPADLDLHCLQKS